MYLSMWNKWLYATQIEADTVRDRDHLWEKKKYRTWKYTYQYRTVNYCFFFATLFSGFLHNKTQYSYSEQNQYDSDKRYHLTIFQQTFPPKMKSWSSESMLKHNTMAVAFFFLFCLLFFLFWDRTYWYTFFCFSHHNIAEKSRNKMHTGKGLQQRKTKEKN